MSHCLENPLIKKAKNKMFDEIITMFSQLMDKLANTQQGHKLVDDAGSVIGRLYKNLTDVQGLPPDAAAKICSNIGSSTSKSQ